MRNDDILLLDVLLSAREAVQIANDLTFAKFSQNGMSQLAILEAVETISEKQHHASVSTQRRHTPRFRGPILQGCVIALYMNISESTQRGYGRQ